MKTTKMNFRYTRVILRKLVVIVLRSKAQSEQNLFFSKAKKRTIKHSKNAKISPHKIASLSLRASTNDSSADARA